MPSIFEESHNIGNILDNMDEYINKIANKINLRDTETFELIYEQISEKINLCYKAVFNKGSRLPYKLFESLVTIAIIPIVTYYF